MIAPLRLWFLALLFPADDAAWQAVRQQCEHWLRRAMAPRRRMQAKYDWWHDPVTGYPIPWRQPLLWPSGEFDPYHSPPAEVVADMRRRLPPGRWNQTG
jgi:hypothetical protein